MGQKASQAPGREVRRCQDDECRQYFIVVKSSRNRHCNRRCAGFAREAAKRLGMALVALFLWAGVAAAGPIEDLRPGEWYRVPNSRLRDVWPNPRPPGNPWSVIGAWSGGAYDTKRDRLIVWGGGHGDYAGNEVYVFDVNALAWSRLTNPSMNVGGSEASGVYPDGLPRSRHTYEGIEYMGPPFDRFCSFGAGGTYPGAQTPTPRVDCFNFDTVQWEQFANTPTTGTGNCAAYDPVRGHAWAASSNGRLAEFDPVANTWTLRTVDQAGAYYSTAEVDPVRRKLMIIGYGVAASWNIDAPGNLTRTNLVTSGATGIQGASNIGLAYDYATDKMVAWNGGTSVYVLNLSTLVWTLTPPAGTNTVSPTPPDDRGTYGRWRYMPNKNAFIVVNSTDEDVYIYKLSAGGGTPPPSDTVAPAKTATLGAR